MNETGKGNSDTQDPGTQQIFASGLSLSAAIELFRTHVNRRDTIFSTDHWLLPKLEIIRHAFSDPITADEAEGLRDVLYGRRWMRDLLQWISMRPITWSDFFPYRDRLEEERQAEGLRATEEELRKADEKWERTQGRAEEDPKSIAYAKARHITEAEPCPTCGRKPDELDWYYWVSSPTSWHNLCGRAGFRTRCQECDTDIDFFISMLN
jgi:hypothetical protein